MKHFCYLVLVRVLKGFARPFPLRLYFNHVQSFLFVSLLIQLHLTLILILLKLLGECDFFGHSPGLLNLLLHLAVLLVKKLDPTLNDHGTLVGICLSFD